MNWSTFFSVSAGASATLLGLLFVAVPIQLRALTEDPSSRWRALARSTFLNYTNLFILSLMMLFPYINNLVYGYILFVVVGIGIVRLALAWLPVWRGMLGAKHERVVTALWWLVSPTLAYIALGIFAFMTLSNSMTPDVQQSIGYCVVGLFAIVLRNSWNLLFELATETAHGVR